MKRVLAVVIALGLMMIYSGTCYAADDADYPFMVEIIVPENSIDQTGYYHIPGTPGETITLQAKVTNLTDQPLEVNAVPLNAYSGLNGISYQSPTDVDSISYALADESYGMAQYIETVDTLHIVPNGNMIADILVNVPDIDAGTLLGSIRFVVFAGTQQVQNEEVNSSTILINEYLAISTAIQIDLPGSVQPSVSAGIAKLTDKGLCVPILNGSAMIQEDVSASYQIKDTKDAVLIEGSAELPKMAPMTEAHIFKPWDAAWEEGEYTLSMQISANGETFDYVKPFTIGQEAISQMVESQQSADNLQPTAAEGSGIVTAAAQTTGVAAAQKTIISGLVFGTPVVFVCILLWIHKRKRDKIKRAQFRQLAGRRYAPS